MGLIKSANFRLFRNAVAFANAYKNLGVDISAPIRINGLWVVKYQLPTVNKV